MKICKLFYRGVTIMALVFLSVVIFAPSMQADDPILFTEHVVTTDTPGGKWVYAEDVDGDGDLDILSASTLNDNNPDHEKVTWHENVAGDGTAWTTRVIYSAGENPDWVYAADMDNDGDLDILSTWADGHKIRWHENDGNSPPNFTARVAADISLSGPRAVHAADMDSDGDLDMLSAFFPRDRIVWLENNGGSPPSFPINTITDTADGAVSVYGADVDSDGDIDVLSAARYDNEVAWYENNGALEPTFTPRVITDIAFGANSVYATDVDGDGDLDVLSAGYDANGNIIWYENDGALPPAFTTHVIDTDAAYSFAVYAIDMDNDGDTDVCATLVGGSMVVWYENDGALNPTFTRHVIATSAIGAYSVYAADVNGDDKIDVIAGSSGDNIAWYENGGGGPDTTPPILTPDVSGLLGNNDWYISDVTVNWTITDPDSPISSTSGCDTTIITADTGGTTLTCEATSDGGTASESVTIKRDATVPLVANVVVNPNPVQVNIEIELTALVDGTDAGGSNIASAEFNIDDGSFNPMVAADGTFDAVSEDVTANIGSFAEPAVPKICVRGTDAAGNIGAEECLFLAVYDPNGGFVTGGGWIDSPPGAYVPAPILTGKATFGFVSKYKKGATLPTGQTEFQFQVADLNFHSDSYDWLVVAGHKAMYKGTGTINGTGNYGFMLSAIDEKLTPSTAVDLFRIKIWDKDDADAIIYDNQMNAADDDDPTTAIGGGNIVIHTK